MGAGKSGLFFGTKGVKKTIDGYPLIIHQDKQGKHIPSHHNFQEGKSEIILSIIECQRLIEQFSGTGTRLGNKERVNFNKVIGYYVHPESGQKFQTTYGIIHYSQTGAHIVPAKPCNNV